MKTLCFTIWVLVYPLFCEMCAYYYSKTNKINGHEPISKKTLCRIGGFEVICYALVALTIWFKG